MSEALVLANKLYVGDKVIVYNEKILSKYNTKEHDVCIEGTVISVPTYPIMVQPQHYLVDLSYMGYITGVFHSKPRYFEYSGYLNQEHIWRSIDNSNLILKKQGKLAEVILIDNPFIKDIESI